jgi:type I restriction enzyme S subunit
MSTYPTYKLGEILSYEQPTNYIVESTEYDDSYPVPVLTAGKSFILGYTNETKGVYNKVPVIIFDDFTTASKFVDFKFKVKSSAMKILSCDDSIADIKYMYYLMQITHIQSDTHKRYWISDYSKIPVSLPPLPTQHQIVSRIESLFAELDKAVEHLRTAQQQLKTYRQAVLNHWLNNEDGKWEMVKLGEVADMCLGKMLDKNKNKGTYQPYLRNVNVRWGSFDLDDLLEMKFEESEQERYGIQIGDLIMCEGGEPGRCAIWDIDVPNMKIQKALHRIRVKNLVYNKFVYYLFLLYAQNGRLEKYFTGTTIKHLTGQSLKTVEIPLPLLSEQQRIVKEIESRLSQAEAAEARIAEALQKTEALRQSILKKAFSGEFDL